MAHGSGKVAIITGASRGIGAAVAERLARDGFAGVVNYSSGGKPAAPLVTKIVGAGGKGIAVKADVSDLHAVRALFDGAEKSFGGIDVLVNNAGVMMLAPLTQVSDADFDRQIAINLKGSFNAMREAAKRL